METRRRRGFYFFVNSVIANLFAFVKNEAGTDFNCGNSVKNQAGVAFLVDNEVQNQSGAGYIIFS